MKRRGGSSECFLTQGRVRPKIGFGTKNQKHKDTPTIRGNRTKHKKAHGARKRGMKQGSIQKSTKRFPEGTGQNLAGGPLKKRHTIRNRRHGGKKERRGGVTG